MTVSLVLASASPRRQELLRGIGLEFSVVPADVDESHQVGEAPIDYVTRIAHLKARVVAGKLDIAAAEDVVVLAADTTVDVDGEIVAKPVDDVDARRILRMLSGRTHQVHTAVVGWRGTDVHSVTATTDVTFATLTEAGIDWYLLQGEHLDKAGGYGMQSAGGALVVRIDGSPSNVIGLPLPETIGVLRACGIPFWSAVCGTSAANC
jgi:septum formation protein